MPKTLEEIQREWEPRINAHRQVFHGDIAKDWQTVSFTALRLIHDLTNERRVPTELADGAKEAIRMLIKGRRFTRDGINLAIRKIHAIFDETPELGGVAKQRLAEALDLLFALRISVAEEAEEAEETE